MRFLAFFILILSIPLAHAQKIILLHTNDHHGAFMTGANGENGLAQQATLVKQIREEAARTGAHVLVLSAGDVNTGPPESNLFFAKPDFEAMNMIGYEAMSPGNHEFDRPRDILLDQERIANFDFISSNIIDENGKTLFTPYIIKEKGGKKIAIVGYTTPDVPKITPHANTAGLSFIDPVAASGELVKKLKKENDLVIGLSHLGYFANESHGINAPGDETLARTVPELDIIVGGHTHSELAEPVKIGNTFIVQAKESGQFMGRMDIDLSGPKPVIEKYELIPIKGIKEDPAVKALLQPYLDEGKKQFSRVVGTAGPGFDGPRAEIVGSERPVGTFVAEAQRNAAGADIGLARGKSMRTGFPAGDITLKNLLSLNPLGHVIITTELDGAEVWKFVEAAQKSMMVKGNRAYFSQGLVVEVEGEKVVGVSLNGKKVPNSAVGKYKVSTTDAIAEMVEEFHFIQKHPTIRNTGISDVQAMEKYLKDIGGKLSAQNLGTSTFRAPACSKNILQNYAETISINRNVLD